MDDDIKKLQKTIDILKNKRSNLSKQKLEDSIKITSLTNKSKEIKQEIEQITTSLSVSEAEINHYDSIIKELEQTKNSITLALETAMIIAKQRVSNIQEEILTDQVNEVIDHRKTNNNVNIRKKQIKINSINPTKDGLKINMT